MHGDDDSSWPLFVAIVLWGASLLVLLGSSLMGWALRDGLRGPESHGVLALSRFWGEIGGTICFVVIPLHLAGWFCYWLDHFRRSVDRPPPWINSGGPACQASPEVDPVSLKRQPSGFDEV
jgi:hypothetical protein